MSGFFGRSRSNNALNSANGDGGRSPATPSKPGSRKAASSGYVSPGFSSLDIPASPATPARFPSSASSTSGFVANSLRSLSPEVERPGGLGKKPSASFLGSRVSLESSQASIKSTKSTKSAKEDRGADGTRSVTSGLAAKGQDDEELPTEITGENWRPRPGHPGNLSSTQAATLLALTGSLSSDGTLPPDHVIRSDDLEIHLCRFLRARGWDVEQAREMWNNSIKWKESVDMEDLMANFDFEERDKVAAAGWQMYFHKTDKLGRPIFIQDLAGLDPNVVWTVTTPERVIRNFAVTLENSVRYRYRECTEATTLNSPTGTGRLIEDNLMILDVSGLGLSTFWTFKAKLQELLSILDTNFPELSGRVQIINAPWLFSTIWSYLRGWLPPGTVEKIDIQGTDYKSTLLRFVDEANLPRKVGGTCQCPGGCEVSDEGPWKQAVQDAKRSAKKKLDEGRSRTE